MAIIDNNSNVCSLEEELQAEAVVLKQIQNSLAAKMDFGKVYLPTEEEQKTIDAKSIFVGNVDYGATVEDLEVHFMGCGQIVRTTIPKDKITKKQKK